MQLILKIIRIKLKHLDKWNNIRRKIAEKYDKEIINDQIMKPIETRNGKHVYHQYAIQTQQRDKLIKHLENNKIQTLIHYPVPVHLQKAYKQYSNVSLPVTEKVAQNILSIPIHPWLTKQEITTIIGALNSFQLK